MLTSADQQTITIQHENYATVVVKKDIVKSRTKTVMGQGSAYANVGFENLFERSYDGRIVETYLMDGTIVKGYREKQELSGYENFKEMFNHLIYLPDSSVIKVVDDGEVILMTAEDILEQNNKHGQIGYWL